MYAGGNMKGRPQLPRSIKKTGRATNTLNNNRKIKGYPKAEPPNPTAHVVTTNKNNSLHFTSLSHTLPNPSD